MSLLKTYPQLKIIQTIVRKKKLKTYLVGGFLRDNLLGIPKLDFDFAVGKDAVKTARAFASAVKGAFVLLDKEHGCARVVKKINGVIHTFDFADFRARTFRKDLAHRDFTINTLALDLSNADDETDLKRDLLDLKNGLKDLKAKKVRMVSRGVFKEDPLRTLRAFSLRAALNFKIDALTLKQIKLDKGLLREVSFERVRDELFKVLATDRAAAIIKEMDAIGLLEKIIPQVTVMYGCTQGGFHHLDVWRHTLTALAELENVLKDVEQNDDIKAYLDERIAGDRARRSLIKLALLLHDIGKPETKREEKDRFSFHGHEHAGKNIVHHVARMLKLGKQERFFLEDLVLHHLRPGYLSNFKQPSAKAVYRFFRDAKKEAASVLILSLADQRATRGPLSTKEEEKHHDGICRRLLKEFFTKKNETPVVRLITGHDLIKKLKLKPSPLFGKILAKVAEQQSLRKIATREEALELARRMAQTASDRKK